MASRHARFTRALKCPDCGHDGAAVWEEEDSTASGSKAKRALIRLDGPFHAEEGRARSAGLLIVCNVCDTIQAN